MKWVIGIALCSCMFTGIVRAQEPSVPVILKPDKFAEWGDIPFKDEKAHLDKVAAQAKEWSLSIVYLAVHAGRTACAGEAKARGVRAKSYLSVKGYRWNELFGSMRVGETMPLSRCGYTRRNLVNPALTLISISSAAK